MAATDAGLNCLVETSTIGERALKDVPLIPSPTRGSQLTSVHSILPMISSQRGAAGLGGEENPLSCISVLSLRSVAP